MESIEKKPKPNSSETRSKLEPLNFEIKEISKKELSQVVENAKPSMQACGLCKIVLGDG